MKGQTKIELTNVKTGEVHTIEDHNIVTNWMRNAHDIQFPWACDSFKHTKDVTITGYSTLDTDSPRTPFTDFGGLIMFTEQLEADPNNYYPKGTVTMVGHASTDTYSGVDLTRGSFNANLSTYDLKERTATLIWDFGLEQGNGEIGTVCLCNQVDGKIGYGSKYYSEDTTNGKAPFYHHAGSGGMAMQFRLKYNVDPAETRNYLGYSGFIPVYLNSFTNKAVFMLTCLANNNLVFAVADIDASTVLPFDYIYRTGDTIYHETPGRTQFVEIPVSVTHSVYNTGSSTTKPYGDDYYFTPFDRLMMLSGLDHQGNFWFSNDAYTHSGTSTSNSYESRMFDWKANTARKFTKVNLHTLETEEYEVYNTTNTTIRMNQGYSSTYFGYLSNLCVVDNYMYVNNMYGKLYAINLSNNTDVHEITLDDGTDAPVVVHCTSGSDSTTASISNGNNRGWVVDVLGDKIIFNLTGGLVPRYYSSSTVTDLHADGNMYILDTETFTAKPLCATQKPCCTPSPSTGSATSVPNNQNTGVDHLICHTDSLVRFCYMLYYKSGSGSGSTDITASYTWNSDTKYLFSTVNVCDYGYPPMGLLTINTLSEPVTKTADMTMRITYTINA